MPMPMQDRLPLLISKYLGV